MMTSHDHYGKSYWPVQFALDETNPIELCEEVKAVDWIPKTTDGPEEELTLPP